jgi:hypothetical protein
MFTNVSEEHAASIFRVKESFQNVEMYLPDYGVLFSLLRLLVNPEDGNSSSSSTSVNIYQTIGVYFA